MIESRRGQSRDCRSSLPTLGHTGESLSHGIATRRVVLDSEFFDLPITSPQTGLTGYFITPITGPFKEHLPASWLSEHLLPPNTDIPNFIHRPIEHQYLRPWSAGTHTQDQTKPAKLPLSRR